MKRACLTAFERECETVSPSIRGENGTGALHAVIVQGYRLGCTHQEIVETVRAKFNPRCAPQWQEGTITTMVAGEGKARCFEHAAQVDGRTLIDWPAIDAPSDPNSAAARAARGRPSICVVIPTATLERLDAMVSAFGNGCNRSSYLTGLIEAAHAKQDKAHVK